METPGILMMVTHIITLLRGFHISKMLRVTNCPRTLRVILGTIHPVGMAGPRSQMIHFKSGIIMILRRTNGDGIHMETGIISNFLEIIMSGMLLMNSNTGSSQPLKNGIFGIRFCKPGSS